MWNKPSHPTAVSPEVRQSSHGMPTRQFWSQTASIALPLNVYTGLYLQYAYVIVPCWAVDSTGRADVLTPDFRCMQTQHWEKQELAQYHILRNRFNTTLPSEVLTKFKISKKRFNTLTTETMFDIFSGDIFKLLFFSEAYYIRIVMTRVPRGPLNSKSALPVVMAWRRTVDRPLLEPMKTVCTGAYMHLQISICTERNF